MKKDRYTYICAHRYINISRHTSVRSLLSLTLISAEFFAPHNDDNDNDDDDDLRIRHGKGFHNLVYMSYVKYINLAKRHK
jgi:hypothetical protein